MNVVSDPSCSVQTWRTGGCRACCAFSWPPLCGVLVAVCYVHGFACASGGFHRVSAWFNAFCALASVPGGSGRFSFPRVSVCRMLRDGCEPSMASKCWLGAAAYLRLRVASCCQTAVRMIHCMHAYRQRHARYSTVRTTTTTTPRARRSKCRNSSVLTQFLFRVSRG